MARTATKIPTRLHTAALTSASVLLAWRGAPGAARYVIFRDGKRRATTKARRFNDKKVKPGERHRYRVRAHGKNGRWLGPASKPLLVTVPRPAPPAPGPGNTDPVPGGTITPPPEPGQNLPPVGGDPPASPDPTTPMTPAMVDRLFWRAGFGPSPADRTAWTGKSVGELVDFFLDTPQQLSPTATPPRTQLNGPIDPLASDDELVMEWLDHTGCTARSMTERTTSWA